MFLSRYQLGDMLPLSIRCKNTSSTPTLPAAAPSARIFEDAGGTLVVDKRLPLHDDPDSVAFFLFPLCLDSRFSTGRYTVLYDYVVGGTHRSFESRFEVVAGGNADGHGISMYYMRQPSRDFVLVQTDGGLLRRLRNPRLK
jgi:hypothetical protein